MFIGGVGDLLQYITEDDRFSNLNLDYFEERLHDLELSRQQHEAVADPSDKDAYKQIFEANYVDPGVVDPSAKATNEENQQRPSQSELLTHLDKILPPLELQVDLSKRKQFLVTGFRKNPVMNSFYIYLIVWQCRKKE